MILKALNDLFTEGWALVDASLAPAVKCAACLIDADSVTCTGFYCDETDTQVLYIHDFKKN